MSVLSSSLESLSLTSETDYRHFKQFGLSKAFVDSDLNVFIKFQIYELLARWPSCIHIHSVQASDPTKREKKFQRVALDMNQPGVQQLEFEHVNADDMDIYFNDDQQMIFKPRELTLDEAQEFQAKMENLKTDETDAKTECKAGKDCWIFNRKDKDIPDNTVHRGWLVIFIGLSDAKNRLAKYRKEGKDVAAIQLDQYYCLGDKFPPEKSDDPSKPNSDLNTILNITLIEDMHKEYCKFNGPSTKQLGFTAGTWNSNYIVKKGHALNIGAESTNWDSEKGVNQLISRFWPAWVYFVYTDPNQVLSFIKSNVMFLEKGDPTLANVLNGYSATWNKVVDMITHDSKVQMEREEAISVIDAISPCVDIPPSRPNTPYDRCDYDDCSKIKKHGDPNYCEYHRKECDSYTMTRSNTPMPERPILMENYEIERESNKE